MNDLEQLLTRALRRLDNSRRDGGRPNLAQIVTELDLNAPGSEKARGKIACELIKADLSHHFTPSSGNIDVQVTSVAAIGAHGMLTVADYLADFDGLDFDEEGMLELVEHEYRLRMQAGDVPDIDELNKRFRTLGPQIFDRIVKLRNNLLLETSIRELFSDSSDLQEWQHVDFEPPDVAYLDDDISLAQRLKFVPPFSELSQFARDAISEKLDVVRFDAGDVLLRQGEVADSLLIVLDGTVEIVLDDAGRKHSLARLGKNTVVGEIGMLTREVRSANVVAVTPGCAATISRDDFEHLAGRYPRLSIVMSELIAERVGALTIDALCGKTIDRYRVKHRLGRGGMGIVYSAVDDQGNSAALKMLRHDLTFDRHASRRFHQEAEMVMSLQHPNIVRVYDEFSAFGTSFIAMELCDGPSLSELIRHASALPQSIVRPLMGQIARGLQCAHAAGIAHRDLKPSNVMLTRNGSAKLVDFGLARCPENQNADLTAIGQIMGTPRYMAPEQLNGERGDARSDLFSLGCIAYEMLTGGPLFTSSTWPDLVIERAGWTLPKLEGIWIELERTLCEFLLASLADDPAARPSDLSPVAAWASDVDCFRILEVESDTKVATAATESTLCAKH
jgi:CRP-like cAMP-binding protein